MPLFKLQPYLFYTSLKLRKNQRYKNANGPNIFLPGKLITPTKVIWSSEHASLYLELSTESSSELAFCSPSISQGMQDLTQGKFEFIEESLNDLPSIRTLKCFSINTVRLWKPVLEHLKLQTESMDEVDRRYTLI
ncbi:hypothetical protein NQ317_005393 [Molorchus minor]|uniref:Uncharacterized protein n=1 Tax=Molorchus minor TaxID=1323400 RepID=A0ABQ9IRB5_9CUCU|nr:hypothetical protein NQ317_005393 [Molorchus minor]